MASFIRTLPVSCSFLYGSSKKKTDFLVQINVPHIGGKYNKDEVDLPAQKGGPLLDTAEALRKKILESFEIKDWDLFVEDGE